MRLLELLDSAVVRARATVAARHPDLPPDELERRAAEIGIGAVKFADLSTGRTRDYVFDLDRMLSLTGDTGVYLQYAHARARSILRRLPVDTGPVTDGPLEPAERRLALQLDGYGAAVAAAAGSLEPHRLATYLLALARTFSDFFEACPVLRAADDVRGRRALLCRLTGDTLAAGLGLLGIAAPDQL